jgi:flagellar protein FliO/FliZ
MPSGLGSLLGFAAIIALIPLVLWLLKRTPMGGSAAHGVLRVVAMLPISTNQRLLTVEVGSGDDRRWIVLGVTPGAISALHTMPPQGEAAPAATSPFSQLLAGSLTGRSSRGEDDHAR